MAQINHKTILLLLCFLFGLLLIPSCRYVNIGSDEQNRYPVPSTSNPVLTRTVEIPLINSLTSQPTLTATSIRPANLIITTKTVIPTSIPTIATGKPTETKRFTSGTDTQTPNPPTIIPTLAENHARKKLLELLADNGGCDLPCFWGMTPGQTTVEQAQSMLTPLSSVSDFTVLEAGIGTMSPSIVENKLEISMDVTYLAKDNILDHIYFSGDALRRVTDGYQDVFDSKVFAERLKPYMLQQILSKYGPPRSVLISTLAELPPPERGGDTGMFKIILLYPDQGILVRYTTNMHIKGEYVLGCPANAHVELEIYQTGGRKSLLDLIDQQELEIIQNTFKPIEEVTSISREQFHQTFSQPGDHCIETLAGFWPIPEK